MWCFYRLFSFNNNRFTRPDPISKGSPVQSVLPNIGASITLLLGILAILWPSKIEVFVSIKGVGKEGASEVRATYGGFFAGIALYAMITQTQEAFVALGFGWLAAAFIRLGTLLFGYSTPRNIGGAVFEAAIGLLCITPLII